LAFIAPCCCINGVSVALFAILANIASGCILKQLVFLKTNQNNALKIPENVG